MRRTVWRLLVAGTVALVVTGLTACDDSDEGDDRRRTSTSTSSTSTSTSTTSTTSAPGQGGGGARGEAPESVPEDFPLPPGARFGEPSTGGGKTAVEVLGSTPRDAYEFYRDALPRAGYRIGTSSVTDNDRTFSARLGFVGNGTEGAVGFAAAGPAQAVALELDG